MRKVFIVKANAAIENMFLQNGWLVASLAKEADILVFTGGSDVTPALYGEPLHPATDYNQGRDLREIEVVLDYMFKKPLVGICRGAQFLNVMNGGKLWQHVNNHAIGGTHWVNKLNAAGQVQCTSTHHQQMRAAEGATMLGSSSIATEKYSGWSPNQNQVDGYDLEVLHYGKTNSLCFQPHPEFVRKGHECQSWFFELVEEYSLAGK